MKTSDNHLYSQKIVLLLLMLLLIALPACSKPQDSMESFSFIYMGDPQADPDSGDYSKWGQLLDLASKDKSEPAFVLLGGDLVNDGNDPDEWNDFFAAGGDVLKGMPVYPAMGNHDNTDLFKNQFDLPQNGPGGKEGEFYSFDYGDAHFVVMDSNAMGAASPEDIGWLEQDLAATDRTHKIVMFHHPVYTAIDNPKDEYRAQTIKESFLPVMEKHGVSLVLSGHQHVYMRTYPIKEEVFNPDGIVYLIGASGGKQYEPSEREYFAHALGGEPVYSICTVDKDGISVVSYNSHGDTIDSFLIGEQMDLSLTKDQGNISLDLVWEDSEQNYRLDELSEIVNIGFEGTYSTVNNWPSPAFYSAKGLRLCKILEEAGIYDKAKTITLASADGYQISFTKEQLFGKTRWYFPYVNENRKDEAVPVSPILAYAFKEDPEKSGDLEGYDQKSLCLIFGQSHPGDFTNPAFVEDISKIIVSFEEADTWEAPGSFPLEGVIAKGESVKLQHPNLGLVKIYYTLDGTEPTEMSNIYNPSTYQPELNKPIPITEETTINAIAMGFGKNKSPMASFIFTPSDK